MSNKTLKDAVSILKGLTKEELEYVVNKARSEVDSDRKSIIDLYHCVMCDADHENRECNYYFEILYNNCWELDSHVKWTKKCEEFLVEVGTKDIKEKLLLALNIKNILNSEYADAKVLREVLGKHLKFLGYV